ncbi:[protein-PII] uridylyltransferase [Sandaracinobacteroides saxicola]|uniref:Bifunctional uridylyltransferase/uridylyl-removing enzyme n=1 Tax=Sandaracinobacteroides saxicola TaxID=2759707 RepID=A0A7G5IGB4_9SPHN|nr:[protein-PII] uridylyltransferase [Sandaracinobacteroides saxicola]QMW22406.1 [protein-PII] uridylyltransferase [Sandaracinobacteroides saxicola]
MSEIPNRRAIIDRRAVAESIDAALADCAPDARRGTASRLLKAALTAARAELKRRIAAHPGRGLELAAAHCFLTDQLLRLAHDVALTHLYPAKNPSTAERLSLVAVGGYGRGEMAPFSDVDIMFLTPLRSTPWVEQVVESILYMLWDLGLKVGHSTRTIDEMLRMAKADLSVRTALLEARYVWGDQPLYDEASLRFQREIVSGEARAFIAAKMAERDERHRKLGDSRYVVEPNLKEGKGGLRDLQTLFWIGKFALQARTPEELADKGLFTPAELRQFNRAQNHLWAVRINLHDLVGRAEERLTFDVQRDLAERMGYRARPGVAPVERFMRHYFLTAKTVGDLTGLFIAHLEERFSRSAWLPSLARRPSRLNGFRLNRGRIEIPRDDFFAEDPVRLIELFQLADLHGLEVHPMTMRAANRDAGLIGEGIRRNPRANALFLDILTSPRTPERVLRWMGEAGVFGRFVPDFGRVVAKMQYDMYHHYTVDEHTIHAIGLLNRIEKGELRQDHPLSTAIINQIVSRRVLYVAVLLHDIAKGRGGDHSILGAEVAERLCPRLGLSPAETETVAWLVRYHLLMSATAFKRDLSDFKTIIDFAEAVASPERLRLLLILTVVDIRAVGPGIWNGWKAALLTTLYNSAEEVLRLGHKQTGRNERIADKKARLQSVMGWKDESFAAYAGRFPDSYWLSESPDVLAANMALVAQADLDQSALNVRCTPDATAGATLVTVYAPDHPGIFYRIAGGISLGGANIVDARIHTTRDGMALDNLVIQDPLGGPFDEPARLKRMESAIADALAGKVRLADRLTAKPLARRRQEAFRLAPQVLVDNKASNRFTVVEVNALDRPALLYALTYALYGARVTIHSAHIATYGERAVDVFYLTDLTGDKITSPARIKTLERRLAEVATAPGAPQSAELAA